LLTSVSRLLCFHFLPFQGAIQQHTLRQPTASRITVTEAGSAFSDEGIKAKIIAHGKKKDETKDDVLKLIKADV